MTKQKQADVLKKQQERERVKVQADANKDKIDNPNRPIVCGPKLGPPYTEALFSFCL